MSIWNDRNLFAFYRLPHEDHYVELLQDYREALLLHSYEELEGREGFVVAPFQVTPQTPIVLIEPDAVNAHCQYLDKPTDHARVTGSDDDRTAYHDDFERFHQQLAERRLNKIVLARTVTMTTEERFGYASDLFLRACQRYPRMFVALVALPGDELWLTATPEVLLRGSNGLFHTMALAGTMRLSGEQLAGEGEDMRWAPKDIEEQRYVASYIADRLKALSIDYQEHGPRTVRAADLVHLRSDFEFRLPQEVPISRVLKTLHPTPAVCGLPKAEALSFILQHEHAPRAYYSGFMGPLNWNHETSLFVTLRCMRIKGSSYTLYAGGGLLRESREEQEWQETEAKLQTMRSLF